MKKQEEILAKFIKCYEKPSLKKCSALLGIERTRMFRIFNGSELKMSEYLKINEMIEQKVAPRSSFSKITDECFQTLGDPALREIIDLCERKLSFSKLNQSPVFTAEVYHA